MNPTTKHALVIKGSEEEKRQACIEIRDWAVKNWIPIFKLFEDNPSTTFSEVTIAWDISELSGKWHLIRWNSLAIKKSDFTIHHTVESFKKVFEVEESETNTLPIEFVEWYSGMERKKILKAVERWKKESTIQEFKPI